MNHDLTKQDTLQDDIADEDTVTITGNSFKNMMVSHMILQALEAGGVEQWEGFNTAIENMRVSQPE